MKYQTGDMEMFQRSREYVDTVIIPLNAITFEKGVNQAVASYEYLSLLTYELERELKGRIFLAHPVPYMKESGQEFKNGLLSQWREFYREAGFTYIRFLTTDNKWLSAANQEEILWFPSIQTDKMPKEAIKQVLDDHTEQITELLREAWNTD
ncbi:DUF2487 family protein [Pradoshia eiseniae]|nr:DUF2487 family protein [Pradoshia eiseniae]